MISKAQKFKSKGESILGDQKPSSMEDFLNDTSDGITKDTQIQKSSIPQFHKATDAQDKKLGRLHIQIGQDLIDRLISEIFRRKRDPIVKNKHATQRAIIEDALDAYLPSQMKNEKEIKCRTQ